MTADGHDRDVAARALKESYPCTALLLGDREVEVIERFCTEQPASGQVGAATDAQRWLKFLSSGVARELDLPAYTEDVAAFEEALAELAANDEAGRDAEMVADRNARLQAPGVAELAGLVPVLGKHVRIERYTFDAPGIVRAIEECDRLEPVEQARPCIVVLMRSVGQARPYTLSINAPVAALLAACDGSTDCAGIVRVLQAKRTGHQDDDSLDRKVFGALEALRAKNVLTYVHPTGTPEGDGVVPVRARRRERGSTS